MRGEFRNKRQNFNGYTTARGIFFDEEDFWVVEVYGGERNDDLGIKLYGDDEEISDVVYNQPSIHGVGANESLSILDEEAELPTTDEEIEAFARYALQDDIDGALRYEGPKDLDDLNF